MIQERIKEARKYRKISQEKLADLLHLTKNYISLLETGERNIPQRTLMDIARVLNVNEKWLETGEGDMLAPEDRETQIAEIAAKIYKGDDDDFKLQLINLILEMNNEQIETFKEAIKKLSNIIE